MRPTKEDAEAEKPFTLPQGTVFRSAPFTTQTSTSPPPATPTRTTPARTTPARTTPARTESPRRAKRPQPVAPRSYSSNSDLKELQTPKAVQPAHHGKRQVQEVKFGGGLSTGKVRSILTHMSREFPGSDGWYKAAQWGEDIVQLAETFTESELDFLRAKGPNDVFDYLWQRYVDLSS